MCVFSDCLQYIFKIIRSSIFRFRDIEINEKKPSFSALKRQNPFIQLLTEGKKLRENKTETTSKTTTGTNTELSEEEYLQKGAFINHVVQKEAKK